MSIELLQRLRHHFAYSPVWHRSGLYAAALGGLIHASYNWPFDFDAIDALVAHPELMEFENVVLEIAWTLVVILACAGLMRPSKLERIGSLVGLYFANALGDWVLRTTQSPLGMLGTALFDAVVTTPFTAALSLAQGIQGLAALYVALYFAAIWIAARTIARLAAPRVRARLTRLRAVHHAST